jgi:hypothetical protein
MSDQKIKVIGTKGRFESDQKDRGITVVTDESGTEHVNPYFCGRYGKDGNIRYDGYGIESIKTFLDDSLAVSERRLEVRDLEGMRPTFRQSIVPTAVLEAVNASLKGGAMWVDIRKGALI